MRKRQRTGPSSGQNCWYADNHYDDSTPSIVNYTSSIGYLTVPTTPMLQGERQRLQAHRDTFGGKLLFDLANGRLAKVENARGQDGIGLSVGESFVHVIGISGAS